MSNKITKKCFYSDVIIIVTILFYLLSYSIQSFYYLLSMFSGYILFAEYIFFFIFINKKDNYSKKTYLLYVLLILFISVGCLFNNSGLGSIFNILNMFLLFLISDNIEISKVCINILKVIVLMCYLLFIISNHTFLNPNFVGYIFLLYFIVITNLFETKQNKYLNLLISVPILLITLYFGNKYQCRTAQIISIVYFILKNFISEKLFKLKIVKIILPISFTFGSIISAYFYVSSWKKNLTLDLSMFAEKRLFSGRNLIWNECFELIKKKPFFGVGSHQQLHSHFTYALHNSMMMIITTYGIPIFLTFYYILKKFIDRIYKEKIKEIYFKDLVVSVSCLFFVDYFESYIYWSVFNFIIFFIIVIIINKERKRKSHE